MAHSASEFIPLQLAVLTVSDTRNLDSDTSGQFLIENATKAGHYVQDRQLLPDDIYQIRACVSAWIADPAVQAVLITGGTGFTGRDSTPEAITPLLDKMVDGFGELFRHLSWQEIGTSTLQSRALAGLANRTLIVCMPGSTGACRTAWEGILLEQLDSRSKPCNFVQHLATATACETRG